MVHLLLSNVRRYPRYQSTLYAWQSTLFSYELYGSRRNQLLTLTLTSYPLFLPSRYYHIVGSISLSIADDLPALVYSSEETQQAPYSSFAVLADIDY